MTPQFWQGLAIAGLSLRWLGRVLRAAGELPPLPPPKTGSTELAACLLAWATDAAILAAAFGWFHS